MSENYEVLLNTIYNNVCKNTSSDFIITQTLIGYVKVNDIKSFVEFIEKNKYVINSQKSLLIKVLYEAVRLDRKNIVSYLETLNPPNLLAIIAYAKKSTLNQKIINSNDSSSILENKLNDEEHINMITYIDNYLIENPFSYNLVFQGIIQSDNLLKVKEFLEKHKNNINPNKFYLWVISATFEIIDYLLKFYFKPINKSVYIDSKLNVDLQSYENTIKILIPALESAILNRRKSIVDLILNYIKEKDYKDVLNPLVDDKTYLPLKNYLTAKYLV
jgi:hypothetical protein